MVSFFAETAHSLVPNSVLVALMMLTLDCVTVIKCDDQKQLLKTEFIFGSWFQGESLLMVGSHDSKQPKQEI